MNLQTEIDIAGFWNWWTKELLGLLPSALKSFIHSNSNKIVVSIHNETITLDYFKAGTTEPFLSEQTEIDSQQIDVVRINPQFSRLKYQTVLQINSDNFLHKLIHLPVAAKKNLDQVVGFELDRLTPFNKNNCFYFAIDLNTKPASEFISVLLIAIPRHYFDNLLTICRSCHLIIDRVSSPIIDSEYTSVISQYNLLPAEWKHIPGKLESALKYTLNSCIAGLLALTLALPALYAQHDIDQLQQTLRALEQETKPIDNQQTEINRQISEYEKLLLITRKQPNLLIITNELSKILNDNTWLIHLRYSENQLEIMGYSPTTLATISELESSDYFSKVNLLSPLYQDKQTGLERFHINMNTSIPLPENSESAEPDNSQ